MGKLISRTPAGDNLRRLGAAENMLKVLPTEIPSLSVRVTEGSYILNGKTIFEVETTQIQPLTLPTVGNMWAAILATGSTITVAYGSPSSTGAAIFPNIPTGALLLAGVYLSANTQYITESLIKDLRPIYGISSVIDNHEELSNRDVADAHPISAITGLQDALDSKITAEYLNTKLDKCAAVDGTSSNTFTLQNDLIGSATDNAAILVNRGNLPAAQIRWNEMESMWEISDGSKFVGIATKEDTDTIAGIDPSTIAIKADVNEDIARLETEIATKADENRLDEVIIALADKADRQEMNDAIQNLPNRQMMLEAIAKSEAATTAVDGKADKNSVYTKEEADERFVPKDSSDTFATDEEVNEKLSNYMLTEDIENKFIDVEQDLDNKADKLDVDTALDEKANKNSVYTKEEVDQKIADNASYTKVEVDQKLSEKADINDVYQYLDNTIALFPSIYQPKLSYTPENISNKDIPGGYAGLDSNGKLSVDVIPDLNGQQTYVVNTKAEMEALEDLQAGDKAFILDDGENTGDSYIYDGTQWIKFADADWANVNLSFQNITDKPSTISGYGITDAYTNAEVDTLLATKAAALHTHNANEITTSDELQFTTKERNEKVDALPSADDIPTVSIIDEKIADAVAAIDFVDDNELQNALSDYAKTADVTTAINDAVARIDFVDNDELQTALADYTKSEDLADEINTKVNDALANIDFVDSTELQTAINDAIAEIDFVDDNELQTALSDYAKSADVSTEIDEKVAAAVEAIDFVDDTELQNALADYAKTTDVDDAINGVNNILMNVNTSIDNINTALDDKANKSDLNVFATQEYVDNADALKADKATLFKNDIFNVKQVDEDGSYNLFFHEKNSGGGNQYYNALTNTISYLGVNKPSTAGSDVDIQLYSKDKTSNIGTRINISSQKGLFYLKNGLNLGFPEGREVLVKDDLVDYVTTAYCEETYQKKNENIILVSPNGEQYEISIDNSGTLVATSKNS